MNVLDGEALASCSDDRFINIYNPLKNFELVYTLTTRESILDWHTITYLALENVII